MYVLLPSDGHAASGDPLMPKGVVWGGCHHKGEMATGSPRESQPQ